MGEFLFNMKLKVTKYLLDNLMTYLHSFAYQMNDCPTFKYNHLNAKEVKSKCLHVINILSKQNATFSGIKSNGSSKKK